MEPTNYQNARWLPEPLVLRLLARASSEFREETYDINKIAREAIIELDQ